MTNLVLRHLLDSTCFALAVLLLVRALQPASAALRHILLAAAAAKFALPLSACFAVGQALRSLLPLRAAASPPGVLLYTVRITAAPRTSGLPAFEFVLLSVWLGTAALLLLRWCWRLHRSSCAPGCTTAEDLATLDSARKQLGLRRAVALCASAEAPEPYLTGVWRPVIVLPESLSRRLSTPELRAVLFHELAHMRRQDNLVLACVHALVCLFWFHPLLWWLERTIRAEAETACDELVLAAGIIPETYIQGICKTCRLALFRPLGGRSYVSNSHLTSRLEHIMSGHHLSPKPAQRALALLPLPALLLSILGAGALSNASLRAQSASGNASIADTTCAASGVHMPQGTVIRQADHLLVCSSIAGVARWNATSETERDKSRPVIKVDDAPPISCTPTAPVGDLCTCSNLRFSPGAVVDSPRGPLVCPKAGGTWQPYSTPRATFREDAAFPSAPSPSPSAGVYKLGSGVTAPVLTFSVEPEFSEAARKKKIAATPLVALTVDTDGIPRDVRILRSSAEGKFGQQREAAASLDDQALKAVRQYRFKPGLADGKPVPVALNVEVNFQIF